MGVRSLSNSRIRWLGFVSCYFEEDKERESERLLLLLLDVTVARGKNFKFGLLWVLDFSGPFLFRLYEYGNELGP